MAIKSSRPIKSPFSFWDEWVGSDDGRPTMWIKRLLYFFGWRIDLHKFVKADDPECFHTHPAHALRIVLWGGYEEQLWANEKNLGIFRSWTIGSFGIVTPTYCHRVSKLINGRSSYSLWIRSPVKHEVHLIGDGWIKNRST